MSSFMSVGITCMLVVHVTCCMLYECNAHASSAYYVHFMSVGITIAIYGITCMLRRLYACYKLPVQVC